jgi:putative peptide zinc metalloprotease protein
MGALCLFIIETSDCQPPAIFWYMNGITVKPKTVQIPDLRQELRIEPGAPQVNGAPSWTLFDPVRHMFFQLGKVEFRIFSRWASGSFAGMADDLKSEGVEDEEADAAVARVVEFSLANQLTVRQLGDSVITFTQQKKAQKKAWWRWAVDNYLFFRIPLVRPARFLENTVDWVAPVWSVKALWGFAALALLGLFLVSRQWDAFMASFLYFFSWQGLFYYALGLSAVKIIHELGHAYTATRYGCRVPSMGVSFLIMFPVLYTDTTAAWRLRSRKQRLAIDCAGVTAELMVASLSTLLWVMLPEGPLRSIFFILATSSWIMSLSINLNPFMRFDGYYVLADLLGVANLQPRAFALGKWRMRELLFDLGEEPPEDIPDRLRRGMILYAWMTWAYRLVLFIGIALLVYHLFFKLLGVILFIVEMAVFVARPIWLEMKEWHKRKGAIWGTRRGRLWPWILGVLFILACLPLDRNISAPAVLAPIDATAIVSGDPARIDRILVRNGQNVKAGSIIAELSAPEVDAYRSQRDVRIVQLEAQLARAPSDEKDLANRAVLERELATERAAAQGADRRRQRLVLRAPIDGVISDITPEMHPGRWLNGSETVARVVTPGRYDIQAYVEEDDHWRVEKGAMGRFVPDDLAQPSRPAKLVEQAAAALQFLDQPMLASVHGGPIAVNEDDGKRLKPRKAWYRIRFVAPVDKKKRAAIVQPLSGRIIIDAPGTSLMGGLIRSVTRIIRRESSLTSS